MTTIVQILALWCFDMLLDTDLLLTPDSQTLKQDV